MRLVGISFLLSIASALMSGIVLPLFSISASNTVTRQRSVSILLSNYSHTSPSGIRKPIYAIEAMDAANHALPVVDFHY